MVVCYFFFPSPIWKWGEAGGRGGLLLCPDLASSSKLCLQSVGSNIFLSQWKAGKHQHLHLQFLSLWKENSCSLAPHISLTAESLTVWALLDTQRFLEATAVRWGQCHHARGELGSPVLALTVSWQYLRSHHGSTFQNTHFRGNSGQKELCAFVGVVATLPPSRPSLLLPSWCRAVSSSSLPR